MNIFFKTGAALCIVLCGCQTNAPPPIQNSALLNDLRFLASDSLDGRETGTPGNETARNYIRDRFKILGLKKFDNEYTDPFQFKDRKDLTITRSGVNVAGYIEGVEQDSEYVIISAHFDHLGIKNGEIYNGADDNASGTAALLAAAQFFTENRPNRTLVFAAFDAEEHGLQGAKHFVQNLPMTKEKILLNINMDMISRSSRNELYASGTYHYPHLKLHTENAAENIVFKLIFGHDKPGTHRNDWTSSSDHGVFHKEKIPFIYFGVEDHEDYHKSTDVFNNIDPEFFQNVTNFIISFIKEVDSHLKLRD